MSEIQSAVTPTPEMYCGVTVKPDRDEKKQIRRQYIKVGLVILLNVLLFNVVLMGIAYLIGGFYVSDFSSFSALEEGCRTLFRDYPPLNFVFSCTIPIISETCAIIFGVKLLKIDLRSLFTVKGFSGGDVTALTTVSLGGQTLAALIATILALILEFIGISYPEAVTSFQTSSMAVNIYIYFYVCILGPILEEILYRGVILQGLKQYNKRMAVWISALIFGLMHQNYQQFILGFLIGLALGIITLKSNSLIPSIITHIIVNTSASLLSCSMMAVDNETFQSIASGEYDITSLSPEFILIILLNALIRYGFLFAGIVIFIVFLVKKKNISRPSPAGKSRGWPIIAQSWTWYIILIVYIYLNFIANLQFNK